MKTKLLALMGMALILVAAAACSEGAPDPTRSPTASPTATPGPLVEALTEDEFRKLLTVQDVERVLSAKAPLKTVFFDYKALAAETDPAQVANMDSFYGLSFQTEDGTRGVTFSVVDFDSATSSRGHYETVKSESPGMADMTPPIGDASAGVEVNTAGIGSVLVLLEADRAVQLHTAQPDGQRPLVPLPGLEELARLVTDRLGR